jgi:hypothetical protein
MNEQEQLVALCMKMGAPRAQAEIMASQLAKRADQLVTSRGITRIAAMEHLLQLLVKGRSGEAPPGFEGGAPPPPSTTRP